MVYCKLHQAHLQEISLMQIPVDHVNVYDIWMRVKGPHNYMVTALNPKPSWLVCEVALGTPKTLIKSIRYASAK
jgi:hypothetical protein